MARKARVKSKTGIYHIMLRGIDKRDIFLDNEDRTKFIEYVTKAKNVGNFQLYGYCLMDNHVHLLIKEEEEVGTSIKRITVRYVGWHNKKHERTGHLFQNRYLSEPVETESYLLTALRYIHQNPVKAKMVNKVIDYKWSSYKQYYNNYRGQDSLVDCDFIKNYFKTLKDFSVFMNASNNDECLEYKKRANYNDKHLLELINKRYNIENIINMPKDHRNKTIKEIYDNTDISIRQLGRILGIGKTIIENAIKQDR